MPRNTDTFRTIRVALSDGSIAFNVQGVADEQIIVIGCTDEADADRMAAMLNNAAWIEVMGDAHEIVPSETHARPIEIYDSQDAADELACAREAAGDRPFDDEDVDDCAHEWAETEVEHGEGRMYCLLCGADGDA